MTQLVGHQKNIMRITNLVVVKSKMDKSQAKQILLLHNLVLCGTKPPVIIMMLHLGSTTMGIQVFQQFFFSWKPLFTASNFSLIRPANRLNRAEPEFWHEPDTELVTWYLFFKNPVFGIYRNPKF